MLLSSANSHLPTGPVLSTPPHTSYVAQRPSHTFTRRRRPAIGPAAPVAGYPSVHCVSLSAWNGIGVEGDA